MNIKKRLFTFFFYFFFIFFLLIIFDFLIFSKYYDKEVEKNDRNNIKNKILSYIKHYKADYTDTSYKGLIKYIRKKEKFFRYEDFELDTNKTINRNNAILLFGCSYAEGFGLEGRETPNYKLYKLINRQVFNFAICGAGVQHILAMLREKTFYPNYISDFKPEYAIYIYIPDHLERIHKNIYNSPLAINGYYLNYKLNKFGELEQRRHIFPYLFLKTFIVKSLYDQMDLLYNDSFIHQKYKNFALFNEILLESKKILQEHYPNLKFVILRFRFDNDYSDIMELPFMWDVLESEGFIILDTEKLIGRKYVFDSRDTIEDKYHPSVYAWDLLIPELIKKLNL